MSGINRANFPTEVRINANDVTLTPAEEQEKWLRESTAAVKQHAFYMKRAIDEGNLKDALKHSAAMLSELRTSQLSPQMYYALYMTACDEMRYLENFFNDLSKSGRRYANSERRFHPQPNPEPDMTSSKVQPFTVLVEAMRTTRAQVRRLADFSRRTSCALVTLTYRRLPVC